MLTERPWKVESVLFLVAGLLISISAAGLFLMYLQTRFPELSQENQSFYQFLLNAAGFHGATLVLVHWFLRQHDYPWRRFLGLDRGKRGRAIVLGVLIGLVALPFALGLNWVSAEALTRLYEEPVKQQSVVILEQTTNLTELVSFGLAAVIFAPVVEEILFRGILFPLLKRIGPGSVAYLASALLFAVIHINLVTFVPLVFLGLVLAWLVEWTDNLLAPILAHAVFNLANFIMVIAGRNWLDWV